MVAALLCASFVVVAVPGKAYAAASAPFAEIETAHRAWRRWATLLAAVVLAAGVLIGLDASAALAAPSGPVAVGAAFSGDTRVLAVDSTAANTNVRASSYVGGTGAAVDRQRWTFELIAEGHPYGTTYVIRNVASGRCLASSSSGAQIYITDCLSWSTAQFWHIPRTPAPVGGGYNLRNNSNGLCLDVALAGEGQLVDAFSCFPATWANPDTGQYMSQRWKVQFGGFDCAGEGMLLCVRPSRPSFGVLANWQQHPVSFTGPDDAHVFQYVRWGTLNSEYADRVKDYFELGWLSGFDPAFGTTYMAYWQESTPDMFQFYSLAEQSGGASADSRNHTYMALGRGANEVDIFYDFNPVGTSNRAEGSRFGYVETGVSYWAQNTATLAQAREHRLQMIDGNNVWYRPLLGEASTQQDNVCGNPPTAGSWGQPNTPPWCFSASVLTRTGAGGVTEIDRFNVTKAATAAAEAPETASASHPGEPAAGAGPAIVHNGVDQRKLAACMAVRADSCLQQVPGLAECVAARKVCNVTSPTRADIGRAGLGMSAAQARDAAGRDVVLSGTKGPGSQAVRVTSMSARDYRAASGVDLGGVSAADVLHVVSGDQSVSGLKHATAGHHAYRGYRLVYHAASGTLLHACLGSGCHTRS